MGHWCLFWSDWREAFLISRSYGVGDPMAPSEGEGNSEGEGMSRPGDFGTKEKIPMTQQVSSVGALRHH